MGTAVLMHVGVGFVGVRAVTHMNWAADGLTSMNHALHLALELRAPLCCCLIALPVVLPGVVCLSRCLAALQSCDLLQQLVMVTSRWARALQTRVTITGLQMSLQHLAEMPVLLQLESWFISFYHCCAKFGAYWCIE